MTNTPALHSATQVKGDSKPNLENTNKDAKVDHDNTSSIGEKNVKNSTTIGEDGSAEGEAPNTFVDQGSLEAKQ